MSLLKKAIIIFSLFLLLSGIMLFRRGLLTQQILVEMRKFFHPSQPSEEKEKIRDFEIVKALQEIEAERKKIRKEREELELLENRLLQQEEDLKKRGKEILAIKKEAETFLREKEAKQEEEISWLAGVYGKMRGEEAAQVIQELDTDLALAVLSQMDDRQAGKILAAMDPRQVVKLTRKIGKVKAEGGGMR